MQDFYKRTDVQAAIVAAAQDKEIAFKFSDKGFGKRPDILKYPNDVAELAKQGATSFHASEELWTNPLRINPNLRKIEIDKLRKGWDLVIDIDCPVWDISKITTWLIIKSLKELGIKSISLKFSGNKGFHIGVPFEAFPKKIDNQELALMFPEAPRAIATYLLDYIATKHIEIKGGQDVLFGKRFRVNFSKLKALTKRDDLTQNICKECSRIIKEVKKQKTQFVCPKCETQAESEKSIMQCPKCSTLMEKFESKKAVCECGSNEYFTKFNAEAIIDIDTLLISSRHLYRMEYSFNEKSGLISLPIDPDKVLQFQKAQADPQHAKITEFIFLDRSNAKENEGANLLKVSLDHVAKVEPETVIKKQEDYEEIKDAIPVQFFPPCVLKILEGMEDGRKRGLFVLVNFLTSVGWSYDKIDELLKDWNQKNPEELREVLLKGQTRYHKSRKQKIMPPNCSNKAYYKDLGLCHPDALCGRIKNPVNYSIVKTRSLNNQSAQGRTKLTDEQKEMRRKFREKQKNGDRGSLQRVSGNNQEVQA